MEKVKKQKRISNFALIKASILKVNTLTPNKVNIITLGCSKNLVDSEQILTQLKGNDIDVTHEDETSDANIIIVNTCGFIDLAKKESIDTILHYAEQKNLGVIEKLYVTGCLSQRYKDDLEKEIPEVDAFFGTMDLPALLARFEADYKHELLGERQVTTPHHFAYLKVSEGCNRTCAFCAIPLMRGKHRSQPIESLVKEAKGLARIGVKEIKLIAQELTYYGLDLYKRRALPELLEALSAVEGIEWIRLHYAYPTKFPRDILTTMAENDEICNYLDIPLQHASNAVLDRMRRHITIEETRDLLAFARETAPNIALRTTMLVGFPGETEDEFEEMCRFVEEQKFDRLGVFKYSHEENTRAYEMEDDVPDEVKEERAQLIMEIQRGINWEKNQKLVGTQQKMLVDGYESGYFIGRTYRDSHEVDNQVKVKADKTFLRIGDFVNVKITDAEDFNLYAQTM
jgi:ribosomal protein S12 methylthiotransferase